MTTPPAIERLAATVNDLRPNWNRTRITTALTDAAALRTPEQLVTDALADSSMFASRFRECAARALLLPRRDPGRRAPLWQQRQRSAQLLSVASQFPDFPIVLEAVRECLQDVYDLPALIDLLTRISTRKVRVVEVETPAPSPFAVLRDRSCDTRAYSASAPKLPT